MNEIRQKKMINTKQNYNKNKTKKKLIKTPLARFIATFSLC